MKHLRTFAGCLFILLVSLHGAMAQGTEQKFPDYNFAITPPEGWVQKSDTTEKGARMVKFVPPEGGGLLMLTMEKETAVAEMNDELVADFDKAAIGTGKGRKISGKYIDIHGVKAYERVGDLETAETTVSMVSHVMHADGVFYGITGMLGGVDASQSPEIQKSLSSFRFLTPPKPYAAAMGEIKARARAVHERKITVVWTMGLGVLFLAVFIGVQLNTKKPNLNRRRRSVVSTPPAVPQQKKPLPPMKNQNPETGWKDI